MTRTNSVVIVSQHYAPELTGNAPYVTALARGLATRGVRVEVITTFPHYPDWTRPPSYAWKSSATEDGVLVTRLGHYIPRNPTAWRRLASEVSFGLRVLLQRLPRAGALLLVSPGLISSALARLRCGRYRTAIWVQDLYSRGMRETETGSSRAALLMSKIEAWTLSSPVSVVAIHERFKRAICDELGVGADRVAVMRNWMHLKDVDPVDPGATRTRLGWLEDEIVVLHAGNQGVKQGLESVVEAARYADRTSAPIRFVLLGGGNQHDHLVNLAAGVRRITFMGALGDNEYQAAMRAADILLVNERPGVAEMSVPSKLTSYFSAGRPILAVTDSHSITAEEIRNSGTGVVVHPGSPSRVVAAIRRLHESPAQCDEYGRAGRRFISSTLSEEVALDTMVRTLRLCAPRAPAATGGRSHEDPHETEENL